MRECPKSIWVTLAIFISLCAGGCQAPADTNAKATSEPEVWDPMDWDSPVSVSLPELSDQEKLEKHIEIISQEYPDQYAENPDIEVGPWLKSQSEQDQLVAACLQEYGFAAHAHPGGGIRYDPGVPEVQSDALDDANYICESKYPLDRQYFVLDLSEEQDGLLYDYWDQYYVPCMEAHGHSVSRDGQPSRETFIATIGSSAYPDWWPTDTFDLLPLEDQEAIAGACPPYPPDELLYGT